MDIGWPEIAIIAVVILVLFGSKKLPDAARSLGRSMRILKTEVKGLHDDDSTEAPAAPAAIQAPAVVTTPAEPVRAGDQTSPQ
jgi:sec-independent protein translocase protein TatA